MIADEAKSMKKIILLLKLCGVNFIVKAPTRKSATVVSFKSTKNGSRLTYKVLINCISNNINCNTYISQDIKKEKKTC